MQVPSHVEYERATSVEHALELLARFGPESRVLAGGHSLIPMMKLRLAQPETLIDINGIEGLSRISVQDDELRIGALVRHAQLLSSAVAGEHFPILHDAERVIADPVVRNWGTIGGSLCQADPSEDLSAAFGAVRATAVIRGRDGVRFVPVREFHLGPYETVVAPGELLTELRVPIRPGGGSAYEKVARRVGDWSVAAAGTVLWLAPAAGTAAARTRTRTRTGTRTAAAPATGTRTAAAPATGTRTGTGARTATGTGTGDAGHPIVTEAGIGLAAVGASHFVATEAEDFLRGRPAGSATFAEAGRIAAEHCAPAADQRGPVDYKRHLTAELTARALRRAAARALGPEA